MHPIIINIEAPSIFTNINTTPLIVIGLIIGAIALIPQVKETIKDMIEPFAVFVNVLKGKEKVF